MKTFHVWFKDKTGAQRMELRAKDADDARRQAEAAQRRRHQRFPLTFARLEQAAQTGDAGGLAIDPRLTGQGLTEAWVKAETERRKRDMARYDDDTLKIVKVEEAP